MSRETWSTASETDWSPAETPAARALPTLRSCPCRLQHWIDRAIAILFAAIGVTLFGR